MANYTEHLKLHQWQEEDPVLMEDFNADNLKLDRYVDTVNQQLLDLLDELDEKLRQTNCNVAHLLALERDAARLPTAPQGVFLNALQSEADCGEHSGFRFTTAPIKLGSGTAVREINGLDPLPGGGGLFTASSYVTLGTSNTNDYRFCSDSAACLHSIQGIIYAYQVEDDGPAAKNATYSYRYTLRNERTGAVLYTGETKTETHNESWQYQLLNDTLEVDIEAGVPYVLTVEAALQRCEGTSALRFAANGALMLSSLPYGVTKYQGSFTASDNLDAAMRYSVPLNAACRKATVLLRGYASTGSTEDYNGVSVAVTVNGVPLELTATYPTVQPSGSACREWMFYAPTAMPEQAEVFIQVHCPSAHKLELYDWTLIPL